MRLIEATIKGKEMLMKKEESSDECGEEIFFGSNDEYEFDKWCESLQN